MMTNNRHRQQKGIKLLHQEIRHLRDKTIEGISLVPNEADLLVLVAILHGPDGSAYKDGVFNIKLTFSEDYPVFPPKAVCMTKIFHPNIAPLTGDICLSTLQKDWRPELGLERLLLSIKSLLLTPNPDSALNEEAGKLLLVDRELFFRRAQMLTSIHAKQASKDHQFDSSLVVFRKRPAILEIAAKRIRRF